MYLQVHRPGGAPIKWKFRLVKPVGAIKAAQASRPSQRSGARDTGADRDGLMLATGLIASSVAFGVCCGFLAG